MASKAGNSRGAQLLRQWQGANEGLAASKLLNLDTATYSRFVNGVRKPSAALCFRIEKLTDGVVRAGSWFELPIAEQPAACA